MASPFPEARPEPSDHSRAEMAVFDSLLQRAPQEWLFLHSLWLKTHKTKTDAEADFVVVTDEAVLVLEVKGGVVWRDEGGWHFADARMTRQRVKSEGPFDQARGAMYALKKHLETIGRTDLWNEHVWGYGVVLTDCRLDVPPGDTHASPEMLLDVAGFSSGIESYLRQLGQYWRKRKLNHRPQQIGTARRKEITVALRPNFVRREGTGVASLRARHEILRLTESQYYALDMSDENPRVTVTGAAGSGKTLVALEAVRKSARKGERVLFTCFNRNLGLHLAALVDSLPERLNVVAGHFHQVVHQMGVAFGMKSADPADAGAYSRFLDALALRFLEPPARMFDYIVIDESQDLFSSAILSFLDVISVGGIFRPASRWLMCVDIEQRLYPEAYDSELAARMRGASAVVPLKRIVRYTRWIDGYAREISGTQHLCRSVIDSEDVPEVLWFENNDDLVRRTRHHINRLAGDFRKAGIPMSEIVILCKARHSIPQELLAPGFAVCPVAWDGPRDNRDAISVYTAHSYKGLEAEAVIVIGFDSLKTEEELRLFYVAATRPRTKLAIALPKTLAPFMATAVRRVASDFGGPSSGPERVALDQGKQ